MNNAFEELCCQLAEDESVPPGSGFTRKGRPDGGVECFWKFPNGKEWAWQAKYVASIGNTQWQEIDESVRTALRTHKPNLVRYTVCLPFDFPDARIPGQKSLKEKWDERVKKWQGWANKEGLTVEFDYWGEHHIWERLSRAERGRYYFWFNRELFNQDWFSNQIDVAVANAGDRYTEELHISLPLADVFDGLGRTTRFYDQLKSLVGKIRKSHRDSRFEPEEQEIKALYTKLDDLIQKLLPLIESLSPDKIHPIDFTTIAELSSQISATAWNTERLLRNVVDAWKQQSDTDQVSISQSPYSFKSYALSDLANSASELEHFTQRDLCRLANVSALLLVGEAGNGKTHLFCDIAKQRRAEGLPTLLFLGESFSNDEPWSQIINRLGLSDGKEELLGALQAAAQAAGSKALILIDALNEGEGKILWERELAGFLTTLTRYPWIGIAVSVRSSYEKAIVRSPLVPQKLVRIEHRGFAGREEEAATKFFHRYGLIAPSIPMLAPEFQRPLFLKLFCEGLKKKGLTKVPAGLQGITAIFDFFLEAVNEKLSKPNALDFDEKSNLVQHTVDVLADLMTEKQRWWLKREDAQAALNELLPRDGFDKSLFRHLLSEGVIAADCYSDQERKGTWVEGIRFSYERLQDHLITKRLLDKYLDKNNPATSFSPEQLLGAFLKTAPQGMIEALCIQLPERVGKEVYDLYPEATESYSTAEAFIESLVWRDPAAFCDSTIKHLKAHALRASDYLHDQCLNAFLTVATNPRHPLNADWLHHILLPLSLPDRDAWWSIFLHRQYDEYEHTAVHRLVDWAWADTDKSHISDESIRLCATSLAWFLTTSNRFLRDRATKALVALLTPRISILRQVLQQFLKVDDPYILERLYAVAYGCAMRSGDKQGIGSLASDVYEQVFKDGKPTVHILLRDYARGVIENALWRGIELEIEQLEKIRPPYGSEWYLSIPSDDQVMKYSGASADDGEGSIYHSVMSYGDFGRYVIGTDYSFNWTSCRLNAPVQPTRKEVYQSFIASLSKKQKKSLDEYANVQRHFEIFLRLDDKKRQEEYEGLTEEVFKSLLATMQQALRKMFRSQKQSTLDQYVIPYLSDPDQREEDEYQFDLTIAQRCILRQVFDMGWTRERFERFDRNVSSYLRYARSASKPERIGKKYQWIAYHEFLARVADNFKFKRDHWIDRGTKYEGPWQIGVRDIDLSCLLKKTRQDTWSDLPSWWFQAAFKDWGVDWREQLPDVAWIKQTDHLPSIESLIEVTNPSDGSSWLTLNGFYQWKQPIPASVDEISDSYWRKSFWIGLRSHIVKKQDSEAAFRWLKKRENRRKLERDIPSSHGMLLGEHCWSPAYEHFCTPFYNRLGWSQGYYDHCPKPMLVTTEKYFWERGFDCSIDDSITIMLPTKWIVDGMKLQQRGTEGSFYDTDGNLVAFDPSVQNTGTGALLIHKHRFLKFLDENDCEIIWIASGEKMNWHGSAAHDSYLGRLWVDGTYRVRQNQVSGDFVARFNE